MLKMRKTISVVVALMMFFTITGFSKAATKAAPKPYEIKWFMAGGSQPKDVALIEKAASAYIQKKGLNATLKLQWNDFGSHPDKVGTLIKARQPFDITFTSSWCLD
jgi:putative aldouronate transport system substrate-binding protein